MKFFDRLQGIFFSPETTLKTIAEKPVWAGVLLVIVIGTLFYSAISAPYLKNDQIEVIESNVKLRERYGDEQFEELLDNLRNPSQARIILNYVWSALGFLAGLLISSLVILVLGRIGSTEGRFVQIFAVLVHAHLIDKILGNAVRSALVLMQKSIFQSTTSVAMFFPRLEVTSTAYIILSQIDFFQIWMFGILALGLVHIFKIERKRAFIISYSFWVLKCLLYIGVTYLSMRLFM